MAYQRVRDAERAAAAPRPDPAVTGYLSESTAVQDSSYMHEFMKALARSGDWLRFDAEKAATLLDGTGVPIVAEADEPGRAWVDGLVLYDIDDESDRNPNERPFPFLPTMDPAEYLARDLVGLDLPAIGLRDSARGLGPCENRRMTGLVVDLAQKLSMFSDHWSPKVVARMNDYEIKVVKVKVSSPGMPTRTPTSCSSWSTAS